MVDIAQKAVEIPIRQRAYSALVSHGFSNPEASQVLDISTRTGKRIEGKLSLLPPVVSDRRLKTVLRSLDKILKGKAFGDIKEIKASDVNASMKMVLDRSHPVINHNVNLNVMADFTDVSLVNVGGVEPPTALKDEPIVVKAIRIQKGKKRCACGGMKGHRGPHREKKTPREGAGGKERGRGE